MAPESWALTHPRRGAMGLALPFRGFTWVVRPVLASLNGLTNAMLRLFGVHTRDELATTRTRVQLAMLVGESAGWACSTATSTTCSPGPCGSTSSRSSG